MLRAVKESHQPSRQVHRGGLPPGGVAEEPERRQSLALDPLRPENLQHLIGKGFHVGGAAFFQKEPSELQTHQCVVERQFASPEHPPHLLENRSGFFGSSEPAGDFPFYPENPR